MIGVVLLFLFLLYVIISQIWGISFFPKEEVKDFSVKGVQVSAEEGYLDWQGIADAGLSFGYIKATEGSNYVDDQYRLNWERIKGTNLRKGASHFFSFDSSGTTQAENFLATYHPESGDLPPVVMIELYDDKKANPPDKKTVQNELNAFIAAVSNATGQRLILCVDTDIYQRYIQQTFPECDLWLVNTKEKPTLKSKYSWTFWEYTTEGSLQEKSIKQESLDLVVYKGSKEAFKEFNGTN